MLRLLQRHAEFELTLGLFGFEGLYKLSKAVVCGIGIREAELAAWCGGQRMIDKCCADALSPRGGLDADLQQAATAGDEDGVTGESVVIVGAEAAGFVGDGVDGLVVVLPGGRPVLERTCCG